MLDARHVSPFHPALFMFYFCYRGISLLFYQQYPVDVSIFQPRKFLAWIDAWPSRHLGVITRGQLWPRAERLSLEPTPSCQPIDDHYTMSCTDYFPRTLPTFSLHSSFKCLVRSEKNKTPTTPKTHIPPPLHLMSFARHICILVCCIDRMSVAVFIISDRHDL